MIFSKIYQTGMIALAVVASYFAFNSWYKGNELDALKQTSKAQSEAIQSANAALFRIEKSEKEKSIIEQRRMTEIRYIYNELTKKVAANDKDFKNSKNADCFTATPIDESIANRLRDTISGKAKSN